MWCARKGTDCNYCDVSGECQRSCCALPDAEPFTLTTKNYSTPEEWTEYIPSDNVSIYVITRYNPNGKYGKVIKAYECEFDAVYECNTLNRRSLLKKQYDIIYKVEKCTLHKGE